MVSTKQTDVLEMEREQPSPPRCYLLQLNDMGLHSVNKTDFFSDIKLTLLALNLNAYLLIGTVKF